MAKSKDQYSKEIVDAGIGMHLDNDPSEQPKNTRRFTLNAVQNSDGKRSKLSNERGNLVSAAKPTGFEFIGDCYIGDDTTFVILNNPLTSRDELGIITKDDRYISMVNTGVLGLRITHQCDIKFRLRRGHQRVVYWVDALNKARTFNLDKPYDFYNDAYKTYLAGGGNPDTFVGEKWDINSFNLIKSFSSVPSFNSVTIQEGGGILPGSYNFAVQYVDADLNPTGWITTSNTVNIYNDSTSNTYEKIRGSRNVTSDSQSFPRASKTIRLVLGDLDTSFPYYRVAIIRSANNIGIPDAALVSDLSSTYESVFLYSGNDDALTKTNLADILLDKEVIFAPRHIEQLENRLLLAYTEGKDVNWCNFQQFASKISSELVTKEVILNSVLSDGNVKNANSTFLYRGYMPGEPYSFAAVYLFDDGFLSPSFHIPGTGVTTGSMLKHELNSTYLDIHNCAENNYWGLDANNKTLVGKPVRHHRFPFRKDVNKPLVTKNTNSSTITRYRLKFVISINPDYTPDPTYPVDGDSNPLAIGFKFEYQISTLGSTSNYSGQLVDTDVEDGTVFVAYDDTIALGFVSGSDYLVLADSELSAYQTDPGNQLFIITPTYETYDLDTSVNNDVSEIFGIKFSNIQKPHPNVVGVYIVRNERTDDDRIVLDNALIGPMTEYLQYKSAGLLMPKQYYTADNCGDSGVSGKTLDYFEKGVWFFNPEYQYFNKRFEFDELNIQGRYSETALNMPTISNNGVSPCNLGGFKGLAIQDVQAGTSYNPEVNKKKDKDDDGFDLLVGYRNTEVDYAHLDATLPDKLREIYLTAASYQNFDFNTYYNVSVDNKMGLYITEDDLDVEDLFIGGVVDGRPTNKLLYASLIRNNQSSYSNFLTRPYYKEHNNPFYFGDNEVINNIEVFNGDAQISGFNLVSSVFYDMVVADRAKKSGLWKIIAGAILVVVGVIVAIYTAGAGLTVSAVGLSLLAGLAISYGVSLAMSGIKFEQFKAMVEVDYEKGLKETISDGGTFETIRENLSNGDDTIRWFCDRVSNIYMESTVPFGLRCGLTSGVSDFIDGPAPYNEYGFRSYITEKLTVVDREQGSGRLYKGYTTAEVYDMNLDFMRFNKQKEFLHLPIEYDCCMENSEIFPVRVWNSEQSFQEELTDNFRTFLPNNYVDIEGEHGEITDLYRLGNNLYIHTREALWQLPKNTQERVTGEIVSFIGTGSLFSFLPIKIVDDVLGSGGTQHKWGTAKTKYGVFFISEIENRPFLHGEGLKRIDEGMISFFEENLKSFLSKQLFDKFGVEFENRNNPANPYGTGYVSVFDNKLERIILTKRDYLLLPDKLAELSIVNTIPVIDQGFVFDTSTNKFYQGLEGVEFSNQDYFENKSFTMSYSFLSKPNMWVSWHSYLPNYYIHNQSSLFSTAFGQANLWKHNQLGAAMQTFYGVYYPYIVELVKSSFEDTEFQDLTIQSEARIYDITSKQYVQKVSAMFSHLLAYNDNQSSGEHELIIRENQADPANYLFQQIKNVSGEIRVARVNSNWHLNGLRDYVVNIQVPLFTKEWDEIKDDYFIDKIQNTNAVNLAKSWNELKTFNGKYLIFRLKLFIFEYNNVNLILNYSVETEQDSTRD